MNETQSYICEKSERLDIFLADIMQQSRSQVAQLIKKDAVFVNEEVVNRSGQKLKVNQVVTVVFPSAVSNPAQEINFDIEVLYEDNDVLVINKPSGVVVHPAPSVKEPTLVDWLKLRGIRLSTLSGEERHGIVHRLDKGTSGVMVIAKNNYAHELLSTQLKDKSMGRYYLAVITPPLKDDIISIEKKISRNPNNRLKMVCDDSVGRDSKSLFKNLVLSNDEKSQLIACKLFTGRTHQIRVHLESINRHIIGDKVYAISPKNEKAERILLHAYMIYFIHPTTKESLSFVATLDSYMKEYINNKFNTEQIDEVMDIGYIKHGFTTNS
ncbi:MAG: rRNA synthase [Campylobacterota bacterium]|jgi:23S rRNA pseudouridine1911/1915/1917 synthase|nr:rRNA synthase [Campylobacterota bacterium]